MTADEWLQMALRAPSPASRTLLMEKFKVAKEQERLDGERLVPDAVATFPGATIRDAKLYFRLRALCLLKIDKTGEEARDTARLFSKMRIALDGLSELQQDDEIVQAKLRGCRGMLAEEENRFNDSNLRSNNNP